MGLFDKRDKSKGKKKSDDFDSPVENIDLSAPDPAPQPEPEPAPPREPAKAAPAALAKKAEPVEEEEDDYDPPAFGIDKAIELMRTLPEDNVELVVQVVKLTLESTKVKIPSIIKDATRKQDDIQGRIKVLKGEIAEYEQEIAQRKEEIEGLEADFSETSTVKDRLELAEKLVTKEAKDAGKRVSGSQPAVKAPKPAGLGTPKPGGLPKPKPKTTVVAKK
jgi:hypothetical protein